MLTYSERIGIGAADKDKYLEFALDVAQKAGAATLPFFRADVSVENKLSDGRFDPVTEADRAAERAIRELVRQSYPEHGIYGEEFGLHRGNGLTWVVDPIDGTRAFMAGLLHWGLLLALFDGARPVLGVMYQPFTEEVFYGDGQSAWYRRHDSKRSLHARQNSRIQDAVLATTSPRMYQSDSERAALANLEAAVKLARFGGDCYIYAMLAMGYVDIAMDAGLSPYDIQALIPIIEGAGGVVTTASGEDASMGGFIVASASAGLHEEVLRIINMRGPR